MCASARATRSAADSEPSHTAKPTETACGAGMTSFNPQREQTWLAYTSAMLGFSVVGLYDSDPAKIGREMYDLTVRAVESLVEDNRERPVDIAVIAVPASAAQRVVDQVVAAGITGIMSFAPIQLHVPAEVTLNTVNMAMELERLSFALSNRE